MWKGKEQECCNWVRVSVKFAFQKIKTSVSGYKKAKKEERFSILE